MEEIPSPFVTLNNDDYHALLQRKDEISKEMDALGSIVLTANMNVHVLMQDIVEKKKRSIARIDASTVGRIFLTNMIETAEINEISILVKRLKTAERVNILRSKTNEELVAYQKLLDSQILDDKHKKVLVWKYLKNKQKELQSKTTLGLEINELDVLDVFVGSVIVEEINWLKQNIVNSFD